METKKDELQAVSETEESEGIMGYLADRARFFCKVVVAMLCVIAVLAVVSVLVSALFQGGTPRGIAITVIVVLVMFGLSFSKKVRETITKDRMF